MKKAKIALSVVISSIFALAIFQNQTFFMSEQRLSIDLYFVKYQTPLVTTVIIILFCFFAGLLISFCFSFSYKLKSNKIIKLLRSREASLMKLVSSLREELEETKIVNINQQDSSSEIYEEKSDITEPLQG